MSTEFAFTSRTAELLSRVVGRLATEFPETSPDQVVRCVQVARQLAEESADDPDAFANIVEALAHDYLVKIIAMRTKPEPPPDRRILHLQAIDLPEPSGDPRFNQVIIAGR